MKLSNLLMLTVMFLFINNISKCNVNNKKQISIIFFELNSSTNINETDVNYLYNKIVDELNDYCQLYIFSYRELDSLIKFYNINIFEPFDTIKRRELGLRIGAEKYLKCFITDFKEDSSLIDIYIASCLFEEKPQFINSYKFDSDRKSIKRLAQKMKKEVLNYLLPDLKKKYKGKYLLIGALTIKVIVFFHILFKNKESKKLKREIPNPPEFPY